MGLDQGTHETCTLTVPSRYHVCQWWVVKARYYYLAQRSPRGYLLQKHERVLVVNHLIRLPAPGVVFSPLPAARPKRAAAAATPGAASGDNPLRILYDTAYYKIEGSMQHVS